MECVGKGDIRRISIFGMYISKSLTSTHLCVDGSGEFVPTT